MKKLFLILVLCLVCSSSAFSEKKNWICSKVDKNISKCETQKLGPFKIKATFVGETIGNLPSGNGKLSFEIDGEKIGDYKKGFFVLESDNLNLHTGEIHLDNNIYFLKNKEYYKTQYYNGDVFEGIYYLDTINPKDGTFKVNNGDIYKGSFTTDGNYLNGTYFFKDGKKIKYKNSKEIKSNNQILLILVLIPLIFFITYKLISGNKINNSSRKIINSSKVFLWEKGFRSRGDYSLVIIMTIILGPGTLILISWISKKLLGIYGISEFIDSIFNVDYFIVFIYLILSTLASILWWGYIIIEKVFSKKTDN